MLRGNDFRQADETKLNTSGGKVHDMNWMTRNIRPRLFSLTAAAVVLAGTPTAHAAPSVTRLTPPSALFNFNDPNPPIISRFIEDQRFDLQATLSPDAGQTITGAEFLVDGETVPGTVSLTPATVAGKPAGTLVASLRAYSNTTPGVHTLTVSVLQSDNQ